MSSKKTNQSKKKDAAATAAARARQEGETDEAYAERMKALDEEEGGADPLAPNADGLIVVRAISGFTHQAAVTPDHLEKQKVRLHNESEEAFDARMKRLEGIKTVDEPDVVRRGQRLLVTPEDAARLARLGLVLIGDSEDYLAEQGPKVLQADPDLVRQING